MDKQTPDTTAGSAGSEIRVRFPIGAKLVSIITILLLLSLGAITGLVSVLVSGDIRLTAEDNNFTVNHRSAAEAEVILAMIRSNALVLLDTLNASGLRVEDARRAESFFFERNQDIAAIAVSSSSVSGAGSSLLLNDRFFLSNETDTSLVAVFIEANEEALDRCRRGDVVLLNAAPLFGVPVLALLYPWQEAAAVIFFSSEALNDIFGAGTSQSFLINDEGDLLVHADSGLVRAGVNLGDAPFIRLMWERTEQSFQTLYTDTDGKRYFGAYSKLALAGAAVITNVEYSLVFEGVAATTRRNLFLTGAVLCISILFIWFFSKSISVPLKNLSAAAGHIKGGKFDIDLKAKSRDEIGVLTDSFVEMSRGLAERERLRNTFGRFINETIAEQAMKGELTLGGETKQVTIFFSDIRFFTAISEKLEPREVVEFLNDYMTRMVDCVDKTGGVVDKFIGDAIMAVWGAPISTGSASKDAFNCVRAALSMRLALLEFNKTRGGDKKPIIKIGCGINTGDVVAGQIGSNKRMEYTVIGDAVNLASRTESLNKLFGTDILITENTWNLIGKYLITEEMPPVQIKGKEKPVRIFAVVSIDKDDVPGPRTLAEVRSLLGIIPPDLSKVDVNAEEEKYKL
ncbi:MAG: HAMP domain-containing protein [Spirochaetaceae bacterium]|jgi:adenylate cyclase|nr:HAMP domain-containing protein [Spirochaetaceae bacterium]